MDEQALLEKLRRIEALHAGATTPGERAAAASARERIQERLRAAEKADPPIEYRFSLPDPWERKMFLALARRYGIRPYRNFGQKRQSVMVRVPRRFMDETLWPEFLALSQTLSSFLSDVTDRVIAEAIHADSSDAVEVRALPGA